MSQATPEAPAYTTASVSELSVSPLNGGGHNVYLLLDAPDHGCTVQTPLYEADNDTYD